jgi:GT2 family glycosyltransferase
MRPTLAVVIPAHNAESTLAHCLDALARSTRPVATLTVVDDGSTDQTADLARQHGARLLHTPGGPVGGAAARNLGARQAVEDLVVFIDADVAVHPDTLERFADRFAHDPQLAAAFGSYDDQPPQRNVASLFMNLRHHWTHQHSGPDAWTFWSGCGAVRREPFDAAGGFDASMRGVSIEDIELGMRLWRGGRRIRLDPAIQCTHLKRWGFAQALRTDIFARAVPWTRLLLRHDDLPADLNLGWSARASAVLVWLAILAGVAGLLQPWAWTLAALCLLAVGLINRRFYQFILRRCGWRSPGVIGMHLLYFAYSSAVFGLMLARRRLTRSGEAA